MKHESPEVVDRSREGYLVHDARSSGREVTVTTHIEGLQGTLPRYAVESRVVCRTAEQAAELAKQLREWRVP